MRIDATFITRKHGVTAGLRKAALASALVIGALVLLRLLPAAPLAAHASYSAAFYAESGELLRLTTAADEQYRLWTPLDEMSPQLVEAVLLYEDRWYRYHPGVNPAALVRSAWATFSGERRQGGSTITMQLARKVYGIDSRTVGGKAQQIGAALWLEARYGKREILEAYLNLAPYGGNVEGAGAASLVYFNKRAADLALPEALSLAVIPQNPAARGGKANTPALVQARDRMAAIWLAAHPGDEKLGARHAPAMRTTAQLPFRAPHLTNQLLKDARANDTREVFSTLDLKMQRTLERAISRRLENHRHVGVQNAAALLIDTETMAVKALVGSANFFDDAIDGQVNGTLAKRSPGSTLKPFIYALGFDQGVLHPMTVLKDAPTAFGPFSPENFDGRFVGPITAQEALVRSRNVPAVQVAARLTRPSLYDLLKQSGVADLASETHYGLALTLGGGEVTMEELARLYAVLANGGKLRPVMHTAAAPRARRGGATACTTAGCAGPTNRPSPRAPQRLLSEESSFVTLRMLESNPRPDTGQPASPPVAWKTGTSWGFRDAWTAGVFDRHVLVVWVGHFDGSSNAAFIGVTAAAPLFFDIVDALRQEGLVRVGEAQPPPARLTRVQVCAATGDLPNAECPQRVATWYLPGVSPIRVSNLHRRIHIDQRTGEAVCDANAHTRQIVTEQWSSDMSRLFGDAGMPRRAAPELPSCGAAADATSAHTTGAPQIVSPLRAVTYTIRLTKPTLIPLKADGPRGRQFWFSNEALIGDVEAGESLGWSPPKAGRYVLRVVDANGRSDSRDLSVEVMP
jgi:penicillin-binding protein 1C